MPRGLRFGICTDQNMSWELTVERWRLFEDLGFDSLWDCDHYVQPSRPTGPYFEGWTLLAGLAAVTRKARIGVLVSCNTFRHPALRREDGGDHRPHLGRASRRRAGGRLVRARAHHVRHRVPVAAGAGVAVPRGRRDRGQPAPQRGDDLQRAALPASGGAVPPPADPASAPAAHPRRARPADAADRGPVRRRLELVRDRRRDAPAQRRPGRAVRRNRPRPVRDLARPLRLGGPDAVRSRGSPSTRSPTWSASIRRPASTSSSSTSRPPSSFRWPSASPPSCSRSCAPRPTATPA